MKATIRTKNILLFILILTSEFALSQNPENWTKDRLMEPSELADAIKANKNVPTIISVGPGALIPGSMDVGSVHEKKHLDSFAKHLKTLKKDDALIIYCGCCPFEHCPNVRPAIDLLKKNGFTNYKLLDLVHNLKTDWIDKGYPISKL